MTDLQSKHDLTLLSASRDVDDHEPRAVFREVFSEVNPGMLRGSQLGHTMGIQRPVWDDDVPRARNVLTRLLMRLAGARPRA